MLFHPETAEFQLEYKVNPKCKLPTEIYLNEKLFYSNGFNVEIQPAAAATWKKVSTNHLEIIHSQNTTPETELKIIITAK